MSSKPLFSRLAGHTFNFGIGRILPQVIGFLLIPVYTNFLTPDDYGIVELATSFSMFLVVFMRLGIPGAVTRFYYDYEEGPELQNYITTIFRLLIIIGGFIAVIVLALGFWFGEQIINGLPYFPFYFLIVATAYLSANTDLQRRLLQVREQSRYSAILSTITAFIGILSAIILVVIFKLGALGMVWASTITAIVFFIQAQFYLRKDLQGRFSKNMLRPSIKYGLGIFPSHIVNNIAPLLSKALLSAIGSLAAVGLLGIALRFVSPLNIVQGAFHNAYLPIYYSLRKENSLEKYQELSAVIKDIWILSCFFFLGTALIMPVLIKLFTPSSYHGSAYLVPFLATGFLFKMIYTFYGQEIFYSKKTFWVPIMSLSSVIINLLIVFLTVKSLGALGVAIGMVSGFFVVMVWGVVLSNRIVKLPVEFGIYLKTTPVLLMIMASFFYFRIHLTLIPELFMGIAFTLFFVLIFILTRDISIGRMLSIIRK